jgi:hypothetical protein
LRVAASRHSSLHSGYIRLSRAIMSVSSLFSLLFPRKISNILNSSKRGQNQTGVPRATFGVVPRTTNLLAHLPPLHHRTRAFHINFVSCSSLEWPQCLGRHVWHHPWGSAGISLCRHVSHRPRGSAGTSLNPRHRPACPASRRNSPTMFCM